MNTTRFIGVDVGLDGTGIGILDCSQNPPSRIFTCVLGSDSKRTIFQRQLGQLKQLRHFLKLGDVVGFEKFSDAGRFSAFSSKLGARIELLGMMKLIARKATRRSFVEVAPTTLRAFASGKISGGGKEVIKNALKREWKIDVGNDDEADALAVAIFTFGLWVANSNGEYSYGLAHRTGRVDFSDKQVKLVKKHSSSYEKLFSFHG